MPNTDEIEFGLWPTPNVPNGGRTMTAEDALNKGKTAKGKRQVGLENAVKFWPSPIATGKRGRPNPEGKHPFSLTLSQTVKLWPTATAGDAKGRAYQYDGKDKGKRSKTLTLVGAAKSGLWSTPRATDGTKGLRTPEGTAKERLRRKNGQELAVQVGGSLNPNWVEWLMGYPIGHTALKDSETPLSRKLRNRSSAGCSKSPKARTGNDKLTHGATT